MEPISPCYVGFIIMGSVSITTPLQLISSFKIKIHEMLINPESVSPFLAAQCFLSPCRASIHKCQTSDVSSVSTQCRIR
jgi:hypothetical protein